MKEGDIFIRAGLKFSNQNKFRYGTPAYTGLFQALVISVYYISIIRLEPSELTVSAVSCCVLTVLTLALQSLLTSCLRCQWKSPPAEALPLESPIVTKYLSKLRQTLRERWHRATTSLFHNFQLSGQHSLYT
jgi:hypothetical protein